MKTSLAFILLLYTQICSGRYFSEHFFRQKPRGIAIEEPKFLDEVCEDAEGLEGECAERAITKGYCANHYEYMRRNCPKSCGFCSNVNTQTTGTTVTTQTSVTTECEDDPGYADGCGYYAAIDGYCEYQKAFMQTYCPKTCGYCSQLTTQPLANIVITQPPTKVVTTQPLANVECKDDPLYDCEDISKEGFCQQQENFTRTYCALSCGWCESPTIKAAAPEICEHDLPKWANSCAKWAKEGNCDDRKKQPFMEHYCRKSCKLPCESVPSPKPRTKPPSPPAFCSDRDRNCGKWKSLGMCESKNVNTKNLMAVYCGVTCETCRAPTPGECYDQGANCKELKKEGECESTVPAMEYEVKTNCLKTCQFCETETTPNPILNTKPPSPPGFCRDRGRNCNHWKSLGRCISDVPAVKYRMAVFCGVTCGTCKAPTPAECYDNEDTNCAELKRDGKCTHTNPFTEYNVKTNCLLTCGFCVPDLP